MKPTDFVFSRSATNEDNGCVGIDLRTWLAAQAMQGLLSQTDTDGGPYYAGFDCFVRCADHAVKHADALIKALNE